MILERRKTGNKGMRYCRHSNYLEARIELPSSYGIPPPPPASLYKQEDHRFRPSIQLSTRPTAQRASVLTATVYAVGILLYNLTLAAWSRRPYSTNPYPALFLALCPLNPSMHRPSGSSYHTSILLSPTRSRRIRAPLALLFIFRCPPVIDPSGSTSQSSGLPDRIGQSRAREIPG